jgi:hypothetical protein
MADETEALAYSESLRPITQQQAVLDDLRSRAGLLFSATSIATAFLAGVALRTQGMKPESWIATICFVGVGLLVLRVLWPQAGWIFQLSARVLIESYVEGDHPATLPEMHRELALHMENHYETNKAKLDRLFWFYQAASVLLILEIVAWLVDLARG